MASMKNSERAMPNTSTRMNVKRGFQLSAGAAVTAAVVVVVVVDAAVHDPASTSRHPSRIATCTATSEFLAEN